jgi:penicillin-binding protein 1A
MNPVRSILDWFRQRQWRGALNDKGKKPKSGKPRKTKAFSPKKYERTRGFFRRVRKVLLLISACGLIYFIFDLPSTAPLTQLSKSPSITIKAADGTLLGTYGDVYGDYIPYDQLPKDLINAVVATEDRNFFYHFGIDPVGVARAIYTDIRTRRMAQGGSTITQQVAKNLFLTPRRSLYRKLQEATLAIWLECKFTKKEILTLYLNRMYFGAGTYGVDAASRRYFGHPARQLTLPESAVLAGLLKAPSKYSPANDPDMSEARGEQVILNMQNAGYLDQKQTDKARRELKLTDTLESSTAFGSFYFNDWVVGQLNALIGKPDVDIVVKTTLLPKLQAAADEIVANGLAKNGKRIRASQGALLAMTPDGAIRAMVGGRDYQQSQYNRATQAERQPGSSFKPFVYLAGVEAGFMPDSMVEDKQIEVGNWSPKNYTGAYMGPVTVAYALAHSINTVAVQISELIGRDKVIAMARRLGITSDMQSLPSIALGSLEVNLLEMTQAYAHLANGGKHVSAYGIESVTTGKGEILYQHQPDPNAAQLIRPNVVAMMNNMLSGVIQYGTGAGANIGRPAAGKTGTTSDYRDAWFIGYTPDLVTGVWVGNDDNRPMRKVTGGALPATLWREFMTKALKGVPVSELPTTYQVEEQNSDLPWQIAPQMQPQQPGMPEGAAPEGMQNGEQPFANPNPYPDATWQPAHPNETPPPENGMAAPNNEPGQEEEIRSNGGGEMPAEPQPEEEQQPGEQKLPQSFWDKLMGGSDGERAQ